MILEVGKAGKARFIRFIKKTNIFECGPNGMVLERENNVITLYVTNARCSEIYCVIPLGGNEILKKNKFMGVAYSPEIMLLYGGDIMVMVDFGARKVSVNKPGIKATGKRDWGEDVQIPWKPQYNAMFGLAAGTEVLESGEPEKVQPDCGDQAQFWAWFAEHEEEIVDKTIASGEEAEMMNARIRVQLAVAFPYEKPGSIEFQLGGDGEKNEFAVFHFNRERMKRDAEELGRLMPEALKERWTYHTEA